VVLVDVWPGKVVLRYKMASYTYFICKLIGTITETVGTCCYCQNDVHS